MKQRGEAEKETESANTLILDFWPLEPWENKYLWFKPNTVWYSGSLSKLIYLGKSNLRIYLQNVISTIADEIYSQVIT